MSRAVLLIDIGAEPLPAVTPVTRPPGQWAPKIYEPIDIPPAEGVVTAPVVDGILIEWEPAGIANAVYIVERASANNGPWVEIARTTALRYAYTGSTEQLWWFRVRVSVNGRSGLGGIAPGQARLVPGMQEIEDNIKAGPIGQDLLTAIAGVATNAATLVKQALLQYDTDNGSRSLRAFTARLEEVKITATQAMAIIQETVGVEVDNLSATVEETKQAIGNIDGKLQATYSMKAQVAQDGKIYMASIAAGVYSDGEEVQSEILMFANRFGFLTSDAGGTVYTPFVIDGGVVRIAQAMIGAGWISNAMIGEYIQSDDYVWDIGAGIYTGWRIHKDGTAQFAGDVEVRGTVFADKMVGTFQSTAEIDLTFSITAGSSPEFELGVPVKAGESHRPEVLASLELTSSSGDAVQGCTIYLQRYNTATAAWVDVNTQNYLIGEYTTVTMMYTYLDASRSATTRYRFAISQGTGAGHVTFSRVTGRVTGIR